MSQKQSDLLRLRDLLDHLHMSHGQLEWTEDTDATQYLTDTMLRDLESCRRLCQNLRRSHAAAAPVYN